MPKDTIRISFELTLHEARITRHWLSRRYLDFFPTGSIAKAMHQVLSSLNAELLTLEDEDES